MQSGSGVPPHPPPGGRQIGVQKEEDTKIGVKKAFPNSSTPIDWRSRGVVFLVVEELVPAPRRIMSLPSETASS